jgi:hypothetical protein
MSLVIRRPAGQNISEPVGVSEQTAVLPHELVPGYFFLGLKEYVCGWRERKKEPKERFYSKVSPRHPPQIAITGNVVCERRKIFWRGRLPRHVGDLALVGHRASRYVFCCSGDSREHTRSPPRLLDFQTHNELLRPLSTHVSGEACSIVLIHLDRTFSLLLSTCTSLAIIFFRGPQKSMHRAWYRFKAHITFFSTYLSCLRFWKRTLEGVNGVSKQKIGKEYLHP